MQKVKHDFQVANQEISFGNVYMIQNSWQNCFTLFDRNSCLTFKLSSSQYSEPVVIQTRSQSRYEINTHTKHLVQKHNNFLQPPFRKSAMKLCIIQCYSYQDPVKTLFISCTITEFRVTSFLAFDNCRKNYCQTHEAKSVNSNYFRQIYLQISEKPPGFYKIKNTVSLRFISLSFPSKN